MASYEAELQQAAVGQESIARLAAQAMGTDVTMQAQGSKEAEPQAS
jgi:hypothetical protein